MPNPVVIVFTPVPGRDRRDGWSPALQQRFIEELAGGASVAAAARLVGKNRQAAYALRRRPGSESFARAWDAAVASAAAPAAPTPPLPTQAEAEAAAERGYQEVCSALPQSHEEARLALARMLDGMYGPRAAPEIKSDAGSPNLSAPEGPNLRTIGAPPVAFAGAPLKRRSC